MITIGAPYIEKRDNETFLLSLIQDEVRKRDLVVWYSVDNEWGDFLCKDYADGFLLLCLLLAMHSGQDIRVKAPVSARLLFNIDNTVQPVLVKNSPRYHHINVEAESATAPLYGGRGVGCCCSLGVDSFVSFLKQTDEKTPESYRVTHLTLFNSGQLGYDDVEGTEKNFRGTVISLRSYANEVGLPLVAVNSNLNELYHDSGLTVVQSVIFRTISCALALQKLFGKYSFASSYPIERFMLSYEDTAHMEAAFVPQCSTENMEVILSNPGMTRVEKTKFISQFPITTRYLDVCWASQMTYGKYKEKGEALLSGKKKTNCGRCSKCIRTIMTLELLGKLDQYKGQFDMEYWYTQKDYLYAKALLNKQENIYFDEIKELMSEIGYKPSKKVRRLMMRMRYPALYKVYAFFRRII